MPAAVRPPTHAHRLRSHACGRPGGLPRSRPAEDDPGTTTARWNGTVVAESDDVVTVEGNACFPRSSVREDVLHPSSTHTLCPWKGTASHLTLEVDGRTDPGAARYHPEPRRAAAETTGRVAFWHGVEVR